MNLGELSLTSVTVTTTRAVLEQPVPPDEELNYSHTAHTYIHVHVALLPYYVMGQMALPLGLTWEITGLGVANSDSDVI